MEQPLDNLRQERLAKLQKIKDLGINPYPATTPNHIEVNEARNQKEGEVAIKGRLMGYRGHGKLVFTDLRDESGQIQLCFKADNLDNHQFELVRLLDVGDFIWATGSLFVTAAGELTVQVKDLLLLTKSLRPLPSEHFGLKDEEERFRQRYVDLIINPEVKGLFIKKFKFWEAIRSFMLQRQFVEVETPVLETIAGGADADPFVTHHNALDIDVYLRISMGELWQKRLMVGGFEKTFEIGRQFRNEGMSREHLQDYTQMEFYWAYADYQQGMKVVEELYKTVAQEAFGTLVFDINGHQVDLGKTWPKLDYGETIKEKLGIDIFKTTVPDLRKKLTELKLDFDEEDTKGRLIDMLWKQVRRSIPGPAFLVGHPVEVSPLAKRDPKNLAKVERYQVILGGSEMGNGYSELNDPVDQAERFAEQQRMREAGDTEAQMYDYDFVRALEYGMPPVTGFGVSDRLFWFLAGKSARECVLFPLMKPEFWPIKKSVAKKSSNNSNDYKLEEKVKADFPGMFFAYTTIKKVNITKSDIKLEELKKSVVSTRKDLAPESISELKPISEYIKLFKATNVDYHKQKPSPEALLKRVISGKGIYNINTAVDAYNLAVIETAVGLGGFDSNLISGPVVLRYSQADEQMALLGDGGKITMLEDGHLVYADNERPITLDVNYRDIDRTKITVSTKNIILFADGAPGLSQEEVVAALEKGAMYIQQFCGGEVGPIKVVS